MCYTIAFVSFLLKYLWAPKLSYAAETGRERREGGRKGGKDVPSHSVLWELGYWIKHVLNSFMLWKPLQTFMFLQSLLQILSLSSFSFHFRKTSEAKVLQKNSLLLSKQSMLSYLVMIFSLL